MQEVTRKKIDYRSKHHTHLMNQSDKDTLIVFQGMHANHSDFSKHIFKLDPGKGISAITFIQDSVKPFTK